MQHVDRCCSLADTDTQPQGAGAGAGHRAKAKSCRIVAIQQCVVQQCSSAAGGIGQEEGNACVLVADLGEMTVWAGERGSQCSGFVCNGEGG